MSAQTSPTTAEILRRNFTVWAALMALLALTALLAYVPMGVGNTVASLAIGALKAALVLLLFMELREHHPLPRLAGLATLVWLAILFTLVLADVIARLPVENLRLE